MTDTERGDVEVSPVSHWEDYGGVSEEWGCDKAVEFCSRCGRQMVESVEPGGEWRHKSDENAGLPCCVHDDEDWPCEAERLRRMVLRARKQRDILRAAHTDADGLLAPQVESVIAADLLHAEAMLDEAHVALKRGTETLAAALRAALADRPRPLSPGLRKIVDAYRTDRPETNDDVR